MRLRALPPETAASTRPLAASVQIPRRGFGDKRVRRGSPAETCIRACRVNVGAGTNLVPIVREADVEHRAATEKPLLPRGAVAG